MNLFLTSAFVALISSAIAIPAASPVDLAPRACATLAPSIIAGLSAADPDYASYTGEVRVNRTLTPSGYNNTFSTVITFNYIPDKSTGCMLRITIPKLTRPNQIAYANPDYSGGFQSDVWTIAPDARGFSTWNHLRPRDQFVSTVIFPTRTTDSIFETYLWSGTCPQGGPGTSQPFGGTLSFLIEGSTWQQLEGGVRFFNTLGGKQGIEPIGFSLVYNC